MVPNAQGRLGKVELTITADSFAAAHKTANDAVMPVLSRLAFEADTPLEVTAVSMLDRPRKSVASVPPCSAWCSALPRWSG